MQHAGGKGAAEGGHVVGDRGVQLGRDAVGNVITTGDHNAVEAHVTATKRDAPVAGPATVDVAKELAAIRSLLIKLESEHTKKIGRGLDDADEEADRARRDQIAALFEDRLQ